MIFFFNEENYFSIDRFAQPHQLEVPAVFSLRREP